MRFAALTLMLMLMPHVEAHVDGFGVNFLLQNTQRCLTKTNALKLQIERE